MKKQYKFFLTFITFLMLLVAIETAYLSTSASFDQDKNKLVKLVGLPDLTISNSANFIRHRSLADTFALFFNDPELVEFFPSTFIYNYSDIQYKNPSRIEIEN